MGLPPNDPSSSSLSTVATILGRLTSDSSESAACDVLTACADAIGADAAFLTLTRGDEGFETLRVVVGCDPAWGMEYETQGAFASDPWLRHARQSSEPRAISDIPAVTCGERATLALAQRFGFIRGVVVPMHSPAGVTRLGVLYLAMRTPGHQSQPLTPKGMFAASGIAVALHRWQLARLRAELVARGQLNAIDLRLLRLERERKTSKDVARLTGWSRLSIDSRWQRLNARLHVTSRRRAAQLAAEHGLI